MKRKRQNKTAGKILAVSLGAMFLFTGCGKESENISDYGTESGTSVSTSDGTDSNSGNTTEKKTEVPEPRNGRNLSEQLGGSSFTYSQDFMIGNYNAKIDLKYFVTESETLPSWSMREITEDRVYEKEVVSAILGDTAKEVKRNLSDAQGDSGEVIGVARDVYYTYTGDETATGEETFPGWVEEEQYFIHTYEGKYMGMDYEVCVAYRKSNKSKVIGFGPKNWGDISGDPALKYAMEVEDGKFLVKEPEESGGDWKDAPLSEILKDPENHTTTNIDTLEETGTKFLKESLRIENPPSGFRIKASVPDYKNRDPNQGMVIVESITQLMFMSSEDGISPDQLYNSRVDGYAGGITAVPGYWSVYVDSEGDGISQNNVGSLYITDKGPVAGYFYVFWEYVETLSEQVAILPFNSAMEAFQANVVSELDTSGVTGGPLTVENLLMEYYPMKSPDKGGEATFIPVWVYEITMNNNCYLGNVVQNAIDGSIIHVSYYREQ